MNNFYDLQKAEPVARKEIVITCPECGESLKAVALDNVIQGHCGNTHREVYLTNPG